LCTYEESTVAGTTSIREKIGEPFVTLKTPSQPGMIRETVDCTVAATGQVLAEAIFEGELKPEIGVAKIGNLNGAMASKPSKVFFEGAGTRAMHSSVGGEGNWIGELEYLGTTNRKSSRSNRRREPGARIGPGNDEMG
jgi:hypothetical protein